MSAPDIGVVYTTYNRAGLLRRSLESMSSQTLPRERFEIVVVDDGSADATRDAVSCFEAALAPRYIYQANSGISTARNRALQQVRAPIVLFMDDDDSAHPDLLAQHLEMHRAFPADRFAVLGHTELSEGAAREPLMQFVTQVGNHLFSYSRLRHGQHLDYTRFWGGRTSCKRRFLERHGRFDEDFRFGSEDIELGYRLARHGLRVVYNRHAVSVMLRTLGLRDFALRIYRQGQSNLRFARKHPTRDVAALCGIADLERRWRDMRDRLPVHQQSAYDLEQIYHARAQAGIEPDDRLVWLLYRAYDLVLEGYRLKGSWDASQSP